jgi:hypothetical protein
MTMFPLIRIFVVALTVSLLGAGAQAQEAVSLQIAIKGNRFEPAQISAPANRPLRLTVKNLDATPAEFESVTLRVEKVIAGNSEGVINLRPLQPGRYQFFDDFHQDTTRGVLVVQ